MVLPAMHTGDISTVLTWHMQEESMQHMHKQVSCSSDLFMNAPCVKGDLAELLHQYLVVQL